jgi:Flp pilus assembly protein TadG
MFRFFPGWRGRLSLLQSRRRSEDGATVVEAAFVTPLFVFILFALVELGPFFQQWSSSKNGAAEGGRMATAAGTSERADYDLLVEMRNSLRAVGKNLDYVIVFRAKTIKDNVPQSCVDAAEAGRWAATATPVGAFQASKTSPIVTDYTSTAIESFSWGGASAPNLACFVLYQRHFDEVRTPGPFTYERARVVAVPPEIPVYSLNRFWPSQYRIDYLNGPQDYVGVYVQSSYYSPTGILQSRKIRTTSVNQIEPKTTDRLQQAT